MGERLHTFYLLLEATFPKTRSEYFCCLFRLGTTIAFSEGVFMFMSKTFSLTPAFWCWLSSRHFKEAPRLLNHFGQTCKRADFSKKKKRKEPKKCSPRFTTLFGVWGVFTRQLTHPKAPLEINYLSRAGSPHCSYFIGSESRLTRCEHNQPSPHMRQAHACFRSPEIN